MKLKMPDLGCLLKAVRSFADRLNRAFLFRGAAWLAIAIGLLCAWGDMVMSNMSYLIFDTSSSLWLPGLLMAHDDGDDDVLMFNVAYDKEFVPVVDPVYGDTIGVRDIISRHRLLQLLDSLRGARYNYLFIDVRFEAGDNSECDSALFAALKTMPRLAISTHRPESGFEIADTSLLACAGMSDYRHYYFNGFSHYELLQDGHESVAVKMLHELHGDSLRAICFGMYGDGKHLCYNSIFLPLTDINLDGHDIEDEDGEFSEQILLNLGHDVLDVLTADELHAMTDGKIILVGDFVNDVHSTYIGDVPGPLLTYEAYRQLCRGRHHLSAGYMLTLFIVYTLMAMSMLMRRPLYDIVLERLDIHNRLLRMLLSLVGFSLILSILLLTCYLIWGTTVNLIVPTVVLGVMALTLDIINYYRNNNQSRPI